MSRNIFYENSVKHTTVPRIKLQLIRYNLIRLAGKPLTPNPVIL